MIEVLRMESLGQKLCSVRQEKGIDLEQAARETNIARRYLEALENEDFSVFPGEPSLIGFLNNYAEYLGLNAGEVISAYRNLKIQEQPVPLAELVPKRSFPVIPVVIGVVAVLLIGAAIVFIPRLFVSAADAGAGEETEAVSSDYALGNDGIRQRVYVKDTISVPLNGETVQLTVAGTDSSLSVVTPHGTQVIDLGEEVALDIDDIPGADISIFVSDISRTDPSRGAEIQVSFITAKPQTESASSDTETIPSMALSQVPAAKQTVIFEGSSPYPVTLNAAFRGPCLFRYETDKKARVDDNYETADTLVMQANNGFRVWSSNANAVKLQVIGGGRTAELEIGRPGQVLVLDIKWVRDDDGRYKLVVLEVD